MSTRDAIVNELAQIATRREALESALRVMDSFETPAARKTGTSASVERSTIRTWHVDEGNGTEAPRRGRGRPPRAAKAEPPVTPQPGKMAPGEPSARILAAISEAGTKRADLFARFKDEIRPNIIGLTIARHIKARRVRDDGETVYRETL